MDNCTYIQLTSNEKILVQNHFQSCTRITKRAAQKFFKLYPEIQKKCKQMLLQTPQYEQSSNILRLIVKNDQLHKCQTCGKVLPYQDIRNNSLYCSKKCINKQLALERKNKTNIEKYGDAYPQRLKQQQEKFKQTCLQKYGVEYPTQNQKIINKVKAHYPTKKIKSRKTDIICRHELAFKNLVDKCITVNVQLLFEFSEFLGVKREYKYNFKCLTCRKYFQRSLLLTYSKMFTLFS